MEVLASAVRQLIGVLGVAAVLELFLPADAGLQKYFRMFSGLYILSLLLKPLSYLL
ncbi:MAG: hypothetical protein VB085_04535 [Peptococcaceae bacterium]|nr:hypothetical protein [Peptococcaceae bacterium]